MGHLSIKILHCEIDAAILKIGWQAFNFAGVCIPLHYISYHLELNHMVSNST